MSMDGKKRTSPLPARRAAPEVRPPEFLEKKFDALYAAACAALERHDPCAVRGGACHSMRVAPERHKKYPFCCPGCEHLGAEGCTVESLYCRLWLCEPLERLHLKRTPQGRVPSPLLKELRRLRREAERWGFQVFRGTKQESLAKAARKQKRLAAAGTKPGRKGSV
jgi:hypothetical protein